MKPIVRNAVVVIAIAFAALAGWRVVGLMQAERYAKTDPERALRWRPDDPQARLALAERQLVQGDLVAAQASARHLLAQEPLQGVAFRVLAQVAEKQGNHAEAFRLYRIAERRAPRDLLTRAWLTQRYLEQGDFARALEQVDRILRMSPKRANSLHPVMVQLAQDPAFAKALATVLHADPPWRTGLLAALRDPQTGNPLANGQVMQALQDQDGLSGDEYARWLDSLMMEGRWGEAYARWAGSATKSGGRLPLVYNGDFAEPPTDAGFDWRLRRVPGVLLRFEQVGGTSGAAAYLKFLDRRVPSAGLEQPLMLSAGRYRLSLKAKAQALRSELGLQWVVVCVGAGGVTARSESLEGSFGWREFATDFTIPASGCQGQWLQLINPVPAGAAQRVVGELWVDDVKVDPQS